MAQLWFKAWGEVRYTSGTTPTKYTYTGQYSNTADFGLMYYGARWYDPVLGRFAQADSIVPAAEDPQSFDRYIYGFNDPLRYIDPSGHMACSDAYEFCGQMVFNGKVTLSILRRGLRRYGVKLTGNWNISHANAVYFGVGVVGDKLVEARGANETSEAAFKSVYKNGINFKMEERAGYCGAEYANSGGCTDSASQIRFWSMSGENRNDMSRMVKNVVHELGHAYYDAIGNPALGDSFSRNALIPNQYYYIWEILDWQQHPPSMNPGNKEIGSDLFADTFIAWAYNAWNSNPKFVLDVNNAQNAMNSFLPKP